MYGTDEQRSKALQREIDGLRAAAAAFPHLKKTLRAFDGKVFNCRLEKALREDGNHWIVHLRKGPHQDSWMEIQFNSSTAYCNVWHYCVWVNLSNVKNWDGKRIPAEALIDYAEKQRAEYLKQAADLETARENVSVYRQQLEYLKRQIETITAGIPSHVQSIYDLAYHVRTSY